MLSGQQRITCRRNIAENFNRLSRVHEHYRQQTDRQTTDDRQTDGWTTTNSEREHEFTFAKKHHYRRHFQGRHDIIEVCKKQTLQN